MAEQDPTTTSTTTPTATPAPAAGLAAPVAPAATPANALAAINASADALGAPPPSGPLARGQAEGTGGGGVSNNNGDQSAATQLLSQIPFGAIIGGPLVAGVEAQTMAANATLQYVLKVLFGEDGAGSGKDTNPIASVTFEFSTGASTSTLTVPLLTLVPIPYLLVETMDISFKAAINASSSVQQKDTSSNDFTSKVDGKVGFLWDKANFSAGYSSKSDSSGTKDSKYSVEYTIDVNVHATGHDMPAGTLKVLNMLNDSIKAVPKATT
jgi:hypothetical protein